MLPGLSRLGCSSTPCALHHTKGCLCFIESLGPCARLVVQRLTGKDLQTIFTIDFCRKLCRARVAGSGVLSAFCTAQQNPCPSTSKSQCCWQLMRLVSGSCPPSDHQDQKCAYDEPARNKTWASSDSLLREHTTVVKSSAPATKTQPLRESPQVTGWEVCEISPPSTTACSGAAFASSVAAYSTLVDVACSPLTAWAIALITTPRSPDCCRGEGGGCPSFSVRRTGVSCRFEYKVVPCAVPADRVSSSMPSWSRNTSLKATCPGERAP